MLLPLFWHSDCPVNAMPVLWPAVLATRMQASHGPITVLRQDPFNRGMSWFDIVSGSKNEVQGFMHPLQHALEVYVLLLQVCFFASVAAAFELCMMLGLAAHHPCKACMSSLQCTGHQSMASANVLGVAEVSVLPVCQDFLIRPLCSGIDGIECRNILIFSSLRGVTSSTQLMWCAQLIKDIGRMQCCCSWS